MGDRYANRFYRGWVNKNLNNYRLSYRDTDLLVRAKECNKDSCYRVIKGLWTQLESFIDQHPDFYSSLKPVTYEQEKPLVITEMIDYAKRAGVGPMAAVAGLFAREVGQEVLKQTGQVIVENGGDIFLSVNRDCIIGVYAGEHSPFTGKIGIKVRGNSTPLGVCTSAGTIGPSLSLGRADAVIAISPSPLLADATATGIGNLVKKETDIENALEKARQISGIEGIMIIKKDKLGTWGDIELVKTRKTANNR